MLQSTHIFLGGGGEAEDSKVLDEQFVRILDSSKPLIYIPNAMDSIPYPSCLEWFRSVMEPLGVKRIEMWDDLHPRGQVEDIAGIYLGGGDTGKLLRELRNSRFDSYLVEVARSGIPTYGGSAGAIVLGEDIRTAPEAKRLVTVEAIALKIVPQYSIVCHYKKRQSKKVQLLVEGLGTSIIAIPEKAGGYLRDNKLTNYGTEPITIFRGDGRVQLSPGEHVELW